MVSPRGGVQQRMSTPATAGVPAGAATAGGEAAAHVAFDGVEKTYDGATLVVRRLDLAIRRGEFLTLLGPSGSGKTTTLMMLAGFEVPTRGTIAMNGRRINDLPPHKRDIGVVFQNYALFPHMTVGQNIAFPLSVRRLPRAEIAERVRRALAMVRLEGYEERRPNQLSGGQQQRVALARAMVFGPQLVLMDEPLGALDKKLREHMQLEIKHLHETTGVTVVYVTHDQSEALTMSDRVAVFNDGVVQQVGTPSALYETPENSFVARFIGENNMFEATVENVADGYAAARLPTGERVVARLPGRSDRPAVGVGDRAGLSLRPERARLMTADGGGSGGDPGAGAPPANRLAGTVVETIYLGDHRRVIVDAGGNRDVMVKLPADAEGAAEPLRPGTPVVLRFAPDDCLALDPSPPP
jgi:putative spermidine/putrescine transport system ATP-binding protein